jgi:hypothetical protein
MAILKLPADVKRKKSVVHKLEPKIIHNPLFKGFPDRMAATWNKLYYQ